MALRNRGGRGGGSGTITINQTRIPLVSSLPAVGSSTAGDTVIYNGAVYLFASGSWSALMGVENFTGLSGTIALAQISDDTITKDKLAQAVQDRLDQSAISDSTSLSDMPDDLSGDAGKILAVNAGGDAYVLVDKTDKFSELTGKLGLAQLPAVTASDNGKVLTVVNGAWSVTEADHSGSSTVTDQTFYMFRLPSGTAGNARLSTIAASHLSDSSTVSVEQMSLPVTFPQGVTPESDDAYNYLCFGVPASFSVDSVVFQNNPSNQFSSYELLGTKSVGGVSLKFYSSDAQVRLFYIANQSVTINGS